MTEEINIESFEVTKGGKSGDLLSKKNDDVKLKIGLIACGYFEYWRMYEGLCRGRSERNHKNWSSGRLGF